MTLIEEYIENRDTLDHVFLLIDSKVGIKNSDIDMLDLLSVDPHAVRGDKLALAIGDQRRVLDQKAE